VNRAVTEGVEGEGASRVSYRKTSNTPNVTFGKSRETLDNLILLGEPHLRRALATIQGHNNAYGQNQFFNNSAVRLLQFGSLMLTLFGKTHVRLTPRQRP